MPVRSMRAAATWKAPAYPQAVCDEAAAGAAAQGSGKESGEDRGQVAGTLVRAGAGQDKELGGEIEQTVSGSGQAARSDVEKGIRAQAAGQIAQSDQGHSCEQQRPPARTLAPETAEHDGQSDHEHLKRDGQAHESHLEASPADPG